MEKRPPALVALTGNTAGAQAGCPLDPQCSCVHCRGLVCLFWKAAEELCFASVVRLAARTGTCTERVVCEPVLMCTEQVEESRLWAAGFDDH